MRTLSKYTATLVGLSLALGFSVSVRANVYATNIKFNGALTNIEAGQSVTISYILNEPASAGVTVNVLSSGTVVRTFSTTNSPVGSNSVVWNLKNSGGTTVSPGIYSISVTAAATGYTQWTQISQDTNAGNYVYFPQGLAVNRNTNSPYYGRIFVGNAMHQNPSSIPGNNDTILKFNADGSFADEGPYGDGGYPIQDDGLGSLPYKLRSGGDDRLYMLDWSGQGVVVAFNNILTTNQVVLSGNNYASNPYNPVPLEVANGWGSMDVSGAGTTNGRIWLGDSDDSGAGVWYWQMTNGVANPSDTSGTQAVATGGSLSDVSGGLMVDSNFDVFVAQNLLDTSITNAVMEFVGIPTATSTWAVGANSSAFLDVNDVTIDSRENPKFVAAAGSGPSTGGIQILNPTNGSSIITLDPTDDYSVTAWDEVGNLYAGSTSANRWRVFSPPDGPNQSATYSAFTVQVITPVTIVSIVNSNGTITITFTSATTDLPSYFTLLSAPTVTGPYTAVAGATVANPSPGVFTVSIPSPGTNTFYTVSRSNP